MNHKATTIVYGCGKGGVGKTTSCVVMGHLLGKQGKKVLIIDADHREMHQKASVFLKMLTQKTVYITI